MSVHQVTQPSELLQGDSGPFVALFVASFHDACQPGGQMDQIFTLLAKRNPTLRFYRVDAEEMADLAEKFAIEVVPTVIFVSRNAAVVDRVEGALPGKIAERLEAFKSSLQHVAAAAPSGQNQAELFKRIDALVSANYCVLFMKGSPENPKCKFSKKVLQLFADAKIKPATGSFATFDVLGDEAMRAALKEYSNWPTFPQFFVGGKLVGGVDILEEMGPQELHDLCQPPKAMPAAVMPKPAESLHDRLTRLVNAAPVMVFIKGTPEAPQCGFSAQLCKLLKEDNIVFTSFDILTDDAVRQGLKTFSDWPTYPQLYLHGKLVGGLDVVKELAEEEGGLRAVLQQ